MSSHDLDRRQFLKTAAATGAALMIVPRHVLGRGFRAPSDVVNLATVGVSGMGASNTRAVMGQNVVADSRSGSSRCGIRSHLAVNRRQRSRNRGATLAHRKRSSRRMQNGPPRTRTRRYADSSTNRSRG